ncbi:hypothetical protein ACET3Z_010920 [Daucus carota]
MSTEMFHIHTSMVAANEEVNRLKKINEKLESEKQETELLLVELDAAKQENAYLRNKLKCASEIEAVLRDRLENNEVKLKSFKNASDLVGQYHEKNKSCANIAIGLDYDELNGNKRIVSDKGKLTEVEGVPKILKKVYSPLFKPCEVNFSEEELIIKQEIANEDKEKKDEEATQSSTTVETPQANQGSKKPVKEIKAEDAKKKKKNRNGKFGINKSNNFAYVADAPRKSFKGFVKFLSESYLAGALNANPILYLDVLHQFWTTAVCTTVVQDAVTSLVVNCSIGGQEIEITANDANLALGLPTENYGAMPTEDELIEFFDFINYSGSITLASLNRTNLRKEWSFVFDAVVWAFTCRKTGFDNISSVVQKLVFSMAHNRHINVGALILEELSTRLTMPLDKRGKKIFLPRFIMSTLTHKVNDIHSLPNIDNSQIGNCKQVSKIIFGTLTTKSRVNVSLKITPFMLERFRTYPYPMPDMRAPQTSSSAMIPEPVEVQSQAHPQKSSQAATLSSKTIDVKKPTASVSQKAEVSKKKRKEAPLSVINESESGEIEPESPLVKKSKRDRKIELTTQDSSMSSQKDMVENVPKTQFTNPAPRVYGRRNKDGTHNEDTSIEAPSSTQGELPTLTLEQTNLISQISSSFKALESDSQVPQHSSDMVLETVLTTQNSHLDGERLLAGVDLDDIITTMRDSSVFTEDLIDIQSPSQVQRYEGSTLEGELLKTSPIPLGASLVGATPLTTLADIALAVEARSTIANDPNLGEASTSHLCDSALEGAHRFEAGVHDRNPAKSTPIPMEVPTSSGEQQTVKTTDLSVSQTVTSVTGGSTDTTPPPSSSQASQPHVMTSWLQDIEAQPSTIDDMLVGPIAGLANLSQQLVISNMENQDYQAILLCYNEEVENQKQKIVDEAEEEGNVDAWLSEQHVPEMKEVLARFRREYIIMMSSNAQSLTPPEVYEAIVDIHKAQLRAFHLFGKALEVQLQGQEDKIRKLVKDKMDIIVPSQNEIKNKFQSFSEHMSRMDLTSLETKMSKMQEAFKALFKQHLGHLSLGSASTTSTPKIKDLQDQVAALQTSNSALSSQVQALTTLVESQQTDIKSLVDSHKHLQMQNTVFLGAIMGRINIPLPEHSQVQDLDQQRILRSAQGPGMTQEFDDLLTGLRISLNNNFFTYRKALETTINYIRVLQVPANDQVLEKRIVINLNDAGVDRCMQVNIGYLTSRRASKVDVLINKVKIIANEEKMLLAELKKAQEAAFPEAYLQPSKGVMYVCSTSNNLKHFQVPKHCVMGNKRLIMILESGLKAKKLKTKEDEEMIKILRRYIDDPEANLPKTQINDKDLDDDEQKKDGQNPSGSNPSQTSKAIGGGSESEKGKEKKSGTETQKRGDRRQRKKHDTSQPPQALNIQIPTPG